MAYGVYEIDNNLYENDPGNNLRGKLTEIYAPDIDRMYYNDIIDTAKKRGIIPYDLLYDDALTIWRLVELVSKISATEIGILKL